MRTAAGQCCFYALPQRDALGRSVHARVRTLENLCAGWLVLHKVRNCSGCRPAPDCNKVSGSTLIGGKANALHR